MAIDRIGSKAPPGPPLAPSGVRRAAESARPFEVSPSAGSEATPARAAGTAPAHTALERLRSGEVDVHGYVDLKVEEATAHLAGLPPAELAAIRGSLRERMASDPTLVDLVRTATGTPSDAPSER